MTHPSNLLTLFTIALIAFVAYCVPVIVKAQAYDHMIVIHASAIPRDVNAFVQREWNVRHHPKPVRELGIKKQEIQKAIIDLRGQRKKQRSSSLESAFIDICREQLPKHQFSVLLKEANKRLEMADE